jgi:hypothetical protein
MGIILGKYLAGPTKGAKYGDYWSSNAGDYCNVDNGILRFFEGRTDGYPGTIDGWRCFRCDPASESGKSPLFFPEKYRAPGGFLRP